MKTNSRWQTSRSLAYVMSAVLIFASAAEAQRGGGGRPGGGGGGASRPSGGGGGGMSRPSGGGGGGMSRPSGGGGGGMSRPSAPSVSRPSAPSRPSSPSVSRPAPSVSRPSSPSVSRPSSPSVSRPSGSRPSNGGSVSRPSRPSSGGSVSRPNNGGNRPGNNGNVSRPNNGGNRGNNGNVGRGNNNGRNNGNVGRAPGRVGRPSVSNGTRTPATHYRSRPTNASRSYVQRSHVRHDFGRNRINVTRNYNAYHWGRVNVYSYRPYYTYRTNFWGWYYSPFYTPWTYTWGWYSAPWYGYWNNYWSPYTYYSSPSYYVTDYILSSRMNDTYESGYNSGYVDGVQAARVQPITEDMKTQINTQTQQVSKAFEEDKAVELSDALEDSKFLFVVDENISVKTADGKKCKLLGADLLKAAERVEEGAKAVQMEVVAGKGSCDAGSIVTVSSKDLQEMLNGFAEAVDEGLNDLQTKQDKGEVPVRTQP